MVRKKPAKPKRKKLRKSDGTWVVIGKRAKKKKKRYNCKACSDTGKSSKGRACICQERRDK